MPTPLYPSFLQQAFRLFRKALAPILVTAFFLQISFAQNTALPARIHTIHVESFGSGSTATALRQRIIERLNKSGQLKATDSTTSSDVVLRGSSSIWETGSVVLNPRSKSSRETTYQGYLSIELIDKSNQPLWSYLVTPSRFHSGGITQDLADRAADRLLAAIHSGAIHETDASAAASTQTALRAAGATLPQPLYLKWFESSGMPVTYNATGSEDGIAELAAGKVDFAASDMPLTPATSTSQLAVTHIPTVAGGVVPIYNLAGVGSLRLTPQVLAGIYSGTIRRWNDSRIREANRGERLPDAEISVIHRDDGSGTTFVWTSFLAQASPLANQDWKSRVGYGTHVQWPIGTGATGSDGVAALVQKTPNSIGYVELIYAIQHKLNYAAVQNPAGQFIKADLASITAAAQSAGQDSGIGFRFSILNAPGKSAYPISTFTWLLIPTQGLDAQKKSAIVTLLRWMLTTGQKECSSLGYAPLPHEVATRALQEIDKLR